MEIIRLGLALCFAAIAVAAPPSALHFASAFIDSPRGQSGLLAAGQSGFFTIENICPASPCSADPSQSSTIRVTRTDLSGNVSAVFTFGGSGRSLALAAAVDKSGNLAIGGSSTSPDFPLVSPLQTSGGAFLTKIDPELHGIIYSTKFGSVNAGISSKITAIAIDGSGNAFLTGTTGPGLPVTQAAFQAQSSPTDGAQSAFVAEIVSSGTSLAFSTYYSGNLPAILQGIPLARTLYFPATSPNAISIDPEGNIVIAGITTDNVPVTPGAYSSVTPANAISPTGFAAKFRHDGSGLIWATSLPGAIVSSAAQDPEGNFVLAGNWRPGPAEFPTTPDAIQPARFPAPQSLGIEEHVANGAGLVLKLSSTGDRLIYATYFGSYVIGGDFHEPSPGIGGAARDQDGNLWITGSSAPAALPSGSGAPLGQNYIAELSPDLRTLLALSSVPDGGAGSAIATAGDGTVATLGLGNLLLLAKTGDGPSFLGIAASTAFQISSAIAPTELVTLYGTGIGPVTGRATQIGTDGRIGKSLDSTKVLFNGTPAALLYAGPNQINAIVPESVRGLKELSVEIVTPAGSILVPGVTVQDNAPAIFSTLGGLAAPALNEDGTVNGPSNPAAPGSIVAVWLTGLGSAVSSDDTINALAPQSSQAAVTVRPWLLVTGGDPLPILYSGDAPAQPSGVSQINFRLPESSLNSADSSMPFVVQAGSSVSVPFRIYVKSNQNGQ